MRGSSRCIKLLLYTRLPEYILTQSKGNRTKFHSAKGSLYTVAREMRPNAPAHVVVVLVGVVTEAVGVNMHVRAYMLEPSP